MRRIFFAASPDRSRGTEPLIDFSNRATAGPGARGRPRKTDQKDAVRETSPSGLLGLRKPQPLGADTSATAGEQAQQLVARVLRDVDFGGFCL